MRSRPLPLIFQPRWLRRELMIAQPKIVLAIGATAIGWFLPDYGSVGQAHRIPRHVDIPGVWSGTVFPVYHTAARLHNPGLNREIEDDFRALGDLLRGTLSVKTPAPPDTSGYYETQDTALVAQRIKDAGIVAIDTESDEDGFWGASFSTQPGEGIVVRKGADFDPISAVLESGEIEIVMHNGYYDLQILAEAEIRLATNKLFDTMIAAYLCGEEAQAETPGLP